MSKESERKERLSEMKNRSAQKMQKLSYAAQKKNAGNETEYKKEMGRRARIRWEKVEDKKLINK